MPLTRTFIAGAGGTLALAGALILLGASAAAQSGASPQGQEPPSPPEPPSSAIGASTTAKVLSKMHAVNQMEIDLGKMAQRKGQEVHVRALGSRLARDHAFADRKVLALARSEGVSSEMPTTDAAEQAERQKTMQKLQSVTGLEFDQAFLAATVTMHQSSIRMLSEVEHTTTDAKLRDLLSKVVPILGQHETVAANLGGESTPARRP